MSIEITEKIPLPKGMEIKEKKKKRKQTVYNKFVSKNMRMLKTSGLKPNEKMKKIGKMWDDKKKGIETAIIIDREKEEELILKEVKTPKFKRKYNKRKITKL